MYRSHDVRLQQGGKGRGRGLGGGGSKRKAAEAIDLTEGGQEGAPTAATAPPAAAEAIRSGNAYMLVYRRRGFEDAPGGLSASAQCIKYVLCTCDAKMACCPALMWS